MSRPVRVSATELIDQVLDAGTFTSWDQEPHYPGASEDYLAELAAARESSGADEAVLTGEGLLRGRRVAVIAGEFRFLGGSIGVAAAGRVTAAIRRATAGGLPLLAAPASGGTRMQEGTVAFLQMLRITQAVLEHKAHRLPYLVYLRHPTTGGVLASWGSLGHVTVAEPGALIGFLGPRVYEALHGEPFPEGVQRAENLFRLGLVDAVLPVEQVAAITDRALGILTTRAQAYDPATASAPDADLDADPALEIDTVDALERSRRPDRPGVRELLRHGAQDVIPLNGTGEGENDPALLLALARIGGVSVVVLGQDRRLQTKDAAMGPAALREARRGMRLAGELGLPLLSVVDTPGAALTKQAEEGGLAGEIARSIAEQLSLDTPTVTLMLGQGAGGGALALLPCDRLLAAQHSWLAPLPPEGASAIMHRTTERAAEMAVKQGVGVRSLEAAGVVDRVLAERPDAADEPEEFCRRVAAAVAAELRDLMTVDPVQRARARRERYDRLG
jgi:acetyl-CoA carboxylase beta subunit/acetyl-CoA carboxylase alpha subunit